VKQGITLEAEEGFQFDYITDRFFIVRLKKAE